MKSTKKKAHTLFDSLADSLLLEIFDRILEFKTLIRCTVVCKRFATIVSQIDTVHFQPHDGGDSSGSSSDSDLMARPSMEVLKRRFPLVKNVQIELYHKVTMVNTDSVFLKWRVLYGSENLIENCVIFLGGFDYLVSSSSSAGNELGNQVLSALNPLIRCCLGVIMFKVLYYIFHSVSDLEVLKRVVISDSGKLGKVLVGREEILKSRSFDKKTLLVRKLELSAMGVKIWYAPDLCLPVTGCRIPLPLLFVIRPAAQIIEMERDVQSVLSSFGEEEDKEDKMFNEAVMAMMNNNKKKTHGFDVPSFAL